MHATAELPRGYFELKECSFNRRELRQFVNTSRVSFWDIVHSPTQEKAFHHRCLE